MIKLAMGLMLAALWTGVFAQETGTTGGTAGGSAEGAGQAAAGTTGLSTTAVVVGVGLVVAGVAAASGGDGSPTATTHH